MDKLKESLTLTERDALYSLLALCVISNRRDEEVVGLVTTLGFADLFMTIWRKLNEVYINDQVHLKTVLLPVLLISIWLPVLLGNLSSIIPCINKEGKKVNNYVIK